MTLAPKLHNSIASVKLRWSITYAELMTRGSAVMKPSTSVQISRMEASNAVAKIDAV